MVRSISVYGLIVRKKFIVTLPEELTVWVKPNCGQCIATKTTLDRKGIAYQTRSLMDEPDALEHFMSLGHRSAPIVSAGDEVWSGFRPDRIEAYAESRAA